MKKVRWKNKIGWLFGAAVLVCLLVMPMSSQADDFDEYAMGGTEIDLPPAGGFMGENYSWFTAMEYFPEDTTAIIDDYEAEGRILAATGKEIYMQRNYGSGGSAWDVVATIVSGSMDPSFIRISPDGSRIALGIGYGAPLMVFPTSILSMSSPPNLESHPSVTAYNVNYYDADWADNQYLVINGGSWPGPPYASGVGVLNTNDPSDTGTGLIDNIPGASAGVAVDQLTGRIVTGIGYHTGPPNRTGEIKLWAGGEWSTAPSTALDYEGNTRILAENVLSAAYLAFDKEGALHVGGGDAFGTGGPTENGYGALIRNMVVDRVAATGGPGAPVNESLVAEYREFAPDPCMNDSATGIVYGDWGEALTVVWNPLTMPPDCAGLSGSASEYWNPGVVPRMTTYYPNNPPDFDADGVPDASDNAFMTSNFGQEDTDGDGWGNIADGDFNNDDTVDFRDRSLFRQSYGMSDSDPGYNPDCDMAYDGTVDYQDRARFRTRMGSPTPYY
jgi:hypothetical protein